MKVIRFEIEGLINSYRIPFFRTYHKSFLAPPKSTVIGMLCNISLKSQKEFFEVLDKDLIELSVVIKDIGGKAKDLWSYKTLEKKNRGKSVVRRDKLFLSKYIIYLKIEDNNFFEEILKNLKNPKNIPSLGLDDELINIKNVSTVILEENSSNKINSVFLDKGAKYKAFIKEINKSVQFPMLNMTPTKFIGFDKKGKRVTREKKVEFEFNQVEYINCEIEFLEDIENFIDISLENKLVFY
ncbi:CRISPR-associated protein Cas5 [Poseidonibacter sp.]|uniref:CRISPR-associated protein Cas5 n=1 Tax=Poseidonibacter sp. TaxID=2321188 RepID=UPI003C716224